jgi:PQQ-dependent catabolism-associated beta-propeller protein
VLSAARRCLGVLVFLFPLLLIAACRNAGADPSTERLRVGFVAPPGEEFEAALRGAELGAEEAARAAALMGRTFELRSATARGADPSVRAARKLLREGAFAIMGGFDGETCRALADLAERERVIYLNIGCRSDALRGDHHYTFHVQASEAMYVEAAGPPPPDPALPRLASAMWHDGLSRYGASQLNDRFARRFGRSFDADGWAGWMGAKILWEASLRTGAFSGDALADYLLADRSEFDGHKGESLSFDPIDHQLRQPLYLVYPGGELAAEFRGQEDAAFQLPFENAPLQAERRYVLVTSEVSNTVTAIDAATDEVVSTFRMPARPRGIQLSRDGSLAYVALSDDEPLLQGDEDGIAVIDLRAGRMSGLFRAGSDPEAFAVSPDGRYLYASNEDAGTASVVDLRSGDVLATLVVGVEPEGVAISPDGRWVYVTAETSNTVSVIDGRINEVIASFMVEVRPRAAAFSPDGRWAYVTNEISGSLSLVDVSRHEVVETIDLDGGTAKPVGVVVSPDGQRVYVANGHTNTVSVIDATEFREIALIEVGRRPWGIAIEPDGGRVFTANGLSNDVSIIDTRTNQVVGTVRAGRRPWGVAVTP